MERKTCFKCGIEKPLSCYYKHAQMGDGHLNKCKDCTKSDTKKRHDELLADPEWVESEQKRHREKYHRLGYKDKHKPTPEEKRRVMDAYKLRYPEKQAAKQVASNLLKPFNGAEGHHWSYNEEHYKDVIWLTPKDHMKGHRFMIYDQERKMYRRVDTNELLDTKGKHESFIKWCIENKED